MFEVIILFIILYYVISIYYRKSFDALAMECNDRIINHFNKYSIYSNISDEDLKKSIDTEISNLFNTFRMNYDIDISHAYDIKDYMISNLQEAINISDITTNIPIKILSDSINNQIEISLYCIHKKENIDNRKEYFSAEVKTSFDTMTTTFINKIKSYLLTLRGDKGDTGVKGDKGDEANIDLTPLLFIQQGTGYGNTLDTRHGNTSNPTTSNTYGSPYDKDASMQKLYYDDASHRLFGYNGSTLKRCLTIPEHTGRVYFSDCGDRLGDRTQNISFEEATEVDGDTVKYMNKTYYVYSIGYINALGKFVKNYIRDTNYKKIPYIIFSY